MTGERKLGRFTARALVLLFLTLASCGVAGQSAPVLISGFTSRSARKQVALERMFKAQISRQQERKFHRFLTAEPHPAGSERNNELARYIAETWRQQGLEDVTIRQYDVLNSFPRETSLEMVSPVTYKAEMREAGYAEDPDTQNPRVKSAYLGLSASGEVTAPMVDDLSDELKHFADKNTAYFAN